MNTLCRRHDLLEQLITSLPRSSYWHRRVDGAHRRGGEKPTLHVAVMIEPYLSAILSGAKTVESRFSANRCAPYLGVERDDIILFKRSAGPVCAVASVCQVTYYELSPAILSHIREEYSSRLCAVDDDFWHTRSNKQFATLIEVERTSAVAPFAIAKRDRRGWVTCRSDLRRDAA
jgi:hypothetical protein